ncbi:hypothetical protein EUGRSUZ_J00636 [Eucalyptus grandis]|uniref:Uncharacterized protein n=2 Tax=Eucalyptus grandis TaxID=71139 RepID=A0A059AAB3_EUCGR|nr:hypothetical protein EUGRSUZ_J00636 [Eucalyptus grandis]
MSRSRPATSCILIFVFPGMRILLLVVVVMLLMPAEVFTWFWPINCLLAVQSNSFEVLVRLLQSPLSTLSGPVNKQGETFRLTSLFIEPQRTFLNLPKLLKELQQLLRINLSGHIAHKDLSQDPVGDSLAVFYLPVLPKDRN